jgi:hypothetical protein
MERPDSLYTFVCTICDFTLDQLPPDALEISRAPGSRVTVFQFADGSKHTLRKKKKQTAPTVKETK